MKDMEEEEEEEESCSTVARVCCRGSLLWQYRPSIPVCYIFITLGSSCADHEPNLLWWQLQGEGCVSEEPLCDALPL